MHASKHTRTRTHARTHAHTLSHTRGSGDRYDLERLEAGTELVDENEGLTQEEISKQMKDKAAKSQVRMVGVCVRVC